jgi:glutamate 5-kinase
LIANGHKDRPLAAALEGGSHTWFLPSSTPLAARKQWIAGTLQPSGQLVIDAGAEKALREGGSLLPVGVNSVAGQFSRGDAVVIVSAAGKEIARGLVVYDSGEAGLIAGRHSSDIAELLGYQRRDEIIHRDNLVLMNVAARAD